MNYTIDQFALYKGTLLCQCGSYNHEHASSCLGDTSKGNPHGWHGSLDIVLGYDECFVHVASPENEVGLESMEVKQKHVKERGFRSQTLAQVTVFSFLHKQIHLTCNLDYFLVPSIVPTKMDIKIYFYDSKHDILLENRGMNLFIEILGTKSQPFSYEAILAV